MIIVGVGDEGPAHDHGVSQRMRRRRKPYSQEICPLDNPAERAQAGAVWLSSLGDRGPDPALPQEPPYRKR